MEQSKKTEEEIDKNFCCDIKGTCCGKNYSCNGKKVLIGWVAILAIIMFVCCLSGHHRNFEKGSMERDCMMRWNQQMMQRDNRSEWRGMRNWSQGQQWNRVIGQEQSQQTTTTAPSDVWWANQSTPETVVTGIVR